MGGQEERRERAQGDAVQREREEEGMGVIEIRQRAGET